MTKYNVECMARDAKMIEHEEHADIYDNFINDYIFAEDEAEAIDSAIYFLYDECIARVNSDPENYYGHTVEMGADSVTIYNEDDIPVYEYYNFKAKIVED